MATEEEMLSDLSAADAAGDSELARRIAGQIKAARQPADAHSLPAKIAHYGAKALPAAGGVAGALLAGVPAIPTTVGALATGAAGAGLGAAAGRAGQKAVDQYLGYEKPDLPRDLIDVGETGLRDATFATGAGAATAGLAKAAPAVADLLMGGARAAGRRVLTNVSNSLSKAKPLSDAAVDTAAEHGAFKVFGTSGGAAGRLEAAREEMGQEYARIVSELEKQGITGPDAARLAAQYAARGQTVNASTMNPSVPKIYETAAQQVAGKPAPAGRLDLSQTEELKRSLQDQARSAYAQRQPNEVGQAHEDTASMMRHAVEDAIMQQAAGANRAMRRSGVQDLADQFVPVKQELGNLIEASNVAREGMARASKRNFLSLPDIIAAAGEGPAAGVATHLLRSRGASTAAVTLRGASNLAGGFPAFAPQAERAAMSLAPAAAERQRTAGWLDDLLQLLSQKSSPAPLAQADQQ